MKRSFTTLFLFITITTSFSQDITWSQHVAPIIFKHCTSCHRPGEIGPFSLTNYSEAYAWANMIKYVTGLKYMPPWKADTKYGVEYLGENYLTENQISTIKAWVDDGAPQGNPALTPPVPVFPTGSQVGTPNLVLSFSQSYLHKGNNKDEYRYFVLPTGLTQEKNLVALEMRPGNTKIVHHALFWADSSGTARLLDAQTPEYGFVGGQGQGGGQSNFGSQLPSYVPGSKPNIYTQGMAQKIPANSDIVIQMHYAPTPVDEFDSSVVNLFFADQPVTRFVRSQIMLPSSLINGPFEIQPNTVKEFHGVFETPIAVSLIGISPHCHLLGRNWRVYAVTPSSDTIPLIQIEDWDFNWQGTYHFRNPKVLPKGSKIHAFATYDNTYNNPFNPNSPPKKVTWGEGTSDEMYYLPLLWVPYRQGDENLDLGNISTNVENNPFHFSKTRLYPIYPNPSSGKVRIGFTLSENGPVSLDIFDLNGNIIKTLIKTQLTLSGEHTIDLDISDISHGIYIITLQSKGLNQSQKMIVTH